MSLAEVAVAIDKSTRAVERGPAKLVEQELLGFAGPRKGRQWTKLTLVVAQFGQGYTILGTEL